MFTENFFNLLLDLKEGWSVKSVQTDINKGEISIEVECSLKEIADKKIDELCKMYDHAPRRSWRHLDTMQYKTYITCRLPRIKLVSRKIKTVQPNWASARERHTYLFEQAIIDLLKASKNQTKTAKLMRYGFNVVNLIIHLSAKRGMERRRLSELKFDHLSIDEKSFRKGHNCITVLGHPRSGCILDAEEGRTGELCKSF